jgi:hypothetical protein
MKRGMGGRQTTGDRGLAVNAAAMQEHILRSMGVVPTGTRQVVSMMKNRRQTSFARHATTIIQREQNPAEELVRQIERKQDNYLAQLSLAERLGLVEKPPPPLNPTQWEAVEQQAKARHEHKGLCPICKEMLGKTTAVILSCSHLFHKSCLSSFEKHAGKKVCPICRKQAYDSKHFSETETYYREYSATKIQSAYRGHRARNLFRALRKLHPPTHPLVRRKYFGEQLSAINSQMESQMDRHQRDLEDLFQSIDQQVEASREAVKQFKLKQRGTQDAREAEYKQLQEEDSKTVDEWRRVKQLAYLRQDQDCPICLHEFTARRELCILTCSHVFHVRCIAAFEAFDIRPHPVCPLCRSEYTRTRFYHKLREDLS